MNTAVDVIRRRVALIVLCGLIGFAIPMVIAVTSPDSYRATSRLFVATSAQDVTSANQGNLAAQSRARTYALMATGPELLVRAAQRSGVSISGGELANRITVSAPPDTVLLDISATASSPQEASALSDAVSQELVSLVQNAERPLRGGQPSLGLLVLQPADAGASRVAAIKPALIAVTTVGGVLVGVVIALLIPARLRLFRRRDGAGDAQPPEAADAESPAEPVSTATANAGPAVPATEPAEHSEPVPAQAGSSSASHAGPGSASHAAADRESTAPERRRRTPVETASGGHRARSHDGHRGSGSE